jgi:hypothetical protein
LKQFNFDDLLFDGSDNPMIRRYLQQNAPAMVELELMNQFNAAAALSSNDPLAALNTLRQGFASVNKLAGVNTMFHGVIEKSMDPIITVLRSAGKVLGASSFSIGFSATGPSFELSFPIGQTIRGSLAHDQSESADDDED